MRVFRIIVVLLFATGSLAAYGQSTNNDVLRHTYFLPARVEPWQFRHGGSITYFFLPSDWTNVAVSAPMFNYHFRYYLPAGFSVDGQLSTLILANRLTLGPRWTYSINNFHFGASYHFGYNLGFLNDFGFETQVTAWNNIPSLSAGISFPRSTLTVRAGLEYLGKFYYRTGDNLSGYDEFKLNGAFLGFMLEQKLWKDHIFTFGVEIDRMNFVMVAWPAYPVNKKTYTIPTIHFGLIF